MSAARQTRIEPGLAFSMPVGGGWMVGIYTHDRPRIGSVIWVAEQVFDHSPTIDDIPRISRWRWPILFPLPEAIRRRRVEPIGVVPIPPQLRVYPTFRSGDPHIGWVAFTFRDGVDVNLGRTTDSSLPIESLVNAAGLRDMVDRNSRPEDRPAEMNNQEPNPSQDANR